MTTFKAVLSALIALGGSLGTASTDGKITLAEGIIAGTAALVALAGFYGVDKVQAIRAAHKNA